MRARSIAVAAVVPLLLATSCSIGSSGDRPDRASTSADAAVATRADVNLAPGVRYRSFPADDPIGNGSPVWLVEADLRQRGVTISVASSGLRERESPRYGDCRTAALWCAATGAVAAINGGYFGDGDEARKEIVGLLVGNGMVLSSGPQRRGSRGPYARSVFGIEKDGTPGIRWATGRRGAKADLNWYRDPEQTDPSGTWSVREAVGCGPTLVVSGRPTVTDREERLVSPGRLHRTFVGYSASSGKPAVVVVAVGGAMEYADAAAFMARYFEREHGVACARAMCLDGGGSSQLAYVREGNVETPAPAFLTVPTAIVVRARAQSADGS
ncbi:MAG: phosphodiester glycosidase family protein [Chthonomonadales bacterium]|nr:phosphodiester glycosidase family protein [Chthonomonadales bacterium]